MYQKSYKKGFTFAHQEAEACRPLNVTPEAHLMHCAVTKFLVDSFRGDSDRVTALWKDCNNSLQDIILGYSRSVGGRPLVTTDKEGLVLPNGMKIRYARLHKSDSGEYKYLANARKKEWVKLYGGKITENVCQALSRLVLSDQLLRLTPKLRDLVLRRGEVAEIVSSTHDELISIVPERYASEWLHTMKQEMATPPAWCSDLPLSSSGGYAVSYGACDK